MRHLILGVLILLLSNTTKAQFQSNTAYNNSNSASSSLQIPSKENIRIPSIHPIKVGDKVPDFVFERMLNYHSKSAKISDFRGKVLILDFWSTWCTVCIAQFPKIEKLQKEYKGKVAIIGVGFDQPVKNSIADYIEQTNNTPKEVKIPIAIQQIEDTLLKQYFPFQGLPHEIWIDPDGVLIAITTHRSLTAEKIQSILQGKKTTFAKKKKLIPLNKNDVFLIKPIGKNPVYGSVISGYIDTLSNSNIFGKQENEGVIRLYEVNKSPLVYYKWAYKDSINEIARYGGEKRILLKTSSKYFNIDSTSINGMNDTEYQNYRNNYLFSYELILPSTNTLQQAYSIFRNDLDRHFKVFSKVERVKMKCYKLIQIRNNRSFIFDPSFDATYRVSYKTENDTIQLTDVPIESFVDILNNITDEQSIIVNESGYAGNIKAQIPKHFSSIQKARIELNKIGLDLIPCIKELRMLIISDRNW